jgi:hypothetical protein
MCLHRETKQGDLMVDTSQKEPKDIKEFSRRDFLKFCSLALGGGGITGQFYKYA